MVEEEVIVAVAVVATEVDVIIQGSKHIRIVITRTTLGVIVIRRTVGAPEVRTMIHGVKKRILIAVITMILGVTQLKTIMVAKLIGPKLIEYRFFLKKLVKNLRFLIIRSYEIF